MATHANSTPTSTTRRTASPTTAVVDRGPPPDPTTPIKGTVTPRPEHFFSGAPAPGAYAMLLGGNCLEPVMFDGDMALVSPTELPQVRDLVVLYHVKGGVPWLKRLVMAPMFSVGAPMLPDSEVLPLVVVEMLNPPKQMMFTSDQLRAMHRVVGIIPKAEVEGLRRPVATPKPARRRKAGAA